jgi:hypothetical protein
VLRSLRLSALELLNLLLVYPSCNWRLADVVGNGFSSLTFLSILFSIPILFSFLPLIEGITRLVSIPTLTTVASM